MRRVLFAVVALMIPRTAFALNPALDISQYGHKAWTIREGFTRGYITAIAQTPDGYLWLGTDSGLVRFDGVRTVVWQPPSGETLPSARVNRLLAARDGSLWIATRAGLARWKDGALRDIAELTGQIVSPIMEDRDGAVWVGTIALHDARVCIIQGPAVACHGGAGRLGSAVVGLHEDTGGRVWVATPGALWRWKPGPPEVFPMPAERDSIQSFDEDSGRMLMGTIRGVRQFIGGKSSPYAGAQAAGEVHVARLLRDRDGGLWIGTRGQGLVHIHQGRTEVFTRAQGLSGDDVAALFEDTEGSVWVGTSGGLDRFRDVAAPTFTASQGLSSSRVWSVLSARDGTIWFGTDAGLNQRKGTQFINVPLAPTPNSMFEDSHGRLWVTSIAGAGYFERGRYHAQPGVPGGAAVHAMAEDRTGAVWIAHQDSGLFRVARDGQVHPLSWTSLGRKDFATALAADLVTGGVWLGFQEGGVVYFNDGQVRETYTAAMGLGAGRINALRADPRGGVWAATEGGLSRLQDARVATLTAISGLPCDAVHWSVEDDQGSVWLNTPCGLIRVPVSEVAASAADQAASRARGLHPTVFDSADGVITLSAASGYAPRVTKSADGKIWFTSVDGVSVVDPRHLPFNRVPPPVQVEQIVADDTIHDASLAATTSLRLPALTHNLRIDYTGLSLVAPEKIRFRYKLEGHDRDWQEAGTRRQAFYTDLRPRAYRFRVTASNNDGVWNETGATVAFAVTPAYYQTVWFRALSVAGIAALVWGVHRVRLRIVERHEREIIALNERLMKAQEQERIRIAGELHDGVMQQMLAVTMMLGTAKRQIADNPAAASTIDKVQDKLIQAGTEIRQLSHDLHPPALQEAGLPQAVRAYCEQFSAACGIPVSCEADDRVHELSRGAALALFRIMQEALGNAAKHAAPRSIAVRLTRSNGIVSLVVADDGAGFDESRLGRSGGLGLIMMRERASQLNGTFEFASAAGRGTTIRVSIPFR